VLDQRMLGTASGGCALGFQRKALSAGRRTLVRLAAPDLMKLRASGYRVRGCCARWGPSGASDIVNPSPNIGDLAGVILADSEQKFNTYFRPPSEFFHHGDTEGTEKKQAKKVIRLARKSGDSSRCR
jgi:hypothetical protein